jgi:hypothetical protein
VISSISFDKGVDLFLNSIKQDENHVRFQNYILNSGWEPICTLVNNNKDYTTIFNIKLNTNYNLLYHWNNEILRIFYFDVPDRFERDIGIIPVYEKRIFSQSLENYLNSIDINIIDKLNIKSVLNKPYRYYEISKEAIKFNYSTGVCKDEKGIFKSNIAFYKTKLHTKYYDNLILLNYGSVIEHLTSRLDVILDYEDYRRNKYLKFIYPITMKTIKKELQEPGFVKKVGDYMGTINGTNDLKIDKIDKNKSIISKILRYIRD